MLPQSLAPLLDDWHTPHLLLKFKFHVDQFRSFATLNFNEGE
jgi:hypothetical protein